MITVNITTRPEDLREGIEPTIYIATSKNNGAHTGIVNISPYFFLLIPADLQTVAPDIQFATVEHLQEGIIHHEVIDHIADNEFQEEKAMAKTRAFAAQLAVAQDARGVVYSHIFDREVLIKRAQEKFDEFLSNERDKNRISQQVYERLASLRDAFQVQGYVDLMFVMMILKVFTIPLNLILAGGVIGQAMLSTGDGGHWLIGAGLIWLFNAAFEGLIIFYMKRISQWSLSESLGLLIVVNVVGLIPWVGTFLAVPLFLELKSFWQKIWHKQPRSEAIGKFWELLGVRWQFLIGRVAERIGIRKASQRAKEVLRALQAKVAEYRKKKGIRVINTLVADPEYFPLKNRIRDQIVRKALKGKETSYHMAFYSLNNLIKGYVVYGKAPKKEGMYIYYLAVHPDAQRHGVATRLIEQVIEASLRQGINVISVTTFVKNPACALYDHLSEKIPGVTLRSKQEFTDKLGKAYDYIFDVKDRITAVAGKSALKQCPDIALAMPPGEARRFVEWVAENITHKQHDKQGIKDWTLYILASWAVIPIDAFWQQLQLYRAWRTSGRRGYLWKEFVAQHPKKDRKDIGCLRRKLDFYYNPRPSFWSSVRYHCQNNRRWLKYGEGDVYFEGKKCGIRKLAMTVAQKSDNKWEERTAALIFGFLILAVMALYPLIIFKRPMNWAGILPRYLILSTVWINGLPGPASMGIPGIIRGVPPLKVLRRGSFFPAPRRALFPMPMRAFLPVSWRGLFFRVWQSLKEQQSTIVGGNGTGNVVPNAGPGAGTAVSLFANLKPLSVFEWPLTKWWLYSIRVVYVTVIKPVITLVKRQFMLWIKTSMGVQLGDKGFWTGFNNLVPPIITVYTCNISYETTTYAYIIIV